MIFFIQSQIFIVNSINVLMTDSFNEAEIERERETLLINLFDLLTYQQVVHSAGNSLFVKLNLLALPAPELPLSFYRKK